MYRASLCTVGIILERDLACSENDLSTCAGMRHIPVGVE